MLLVRLAGVEGAITVIAPKTFAPKPWVFRAGFVGRDTTVDLALLARVSHLRRPVSQHRRPTVGALERVYQHLTDHGFQKPVMERRWARGG